jgi:hypothetical protein
MKGDLILDKGLVGVVLSAIGISALLLLGAFYGGCHVEANPPAYPAGSDWVQVG